MPVIVSMLRGINLGGNRQIKMDALRAVYESLDLESVQTYLQSGNVVFITAERNLKSLAARIEQEIERKFGFKVEVILRTPAELRQVIAKNPFARRRAIDPRKLLVTFLVDEPERDACAKVLSLKADPEEVRIEGRELYIYYANGMARPKLPWIKIQKMLNTSGTGRNWNTVQGLLELAEKLER